LENSKKSFPCTLLSLHNLFTIAHRSSGSSSEQRRLMTLCNSNFEAFIEESVRRVNKEIPFLLQAGGYRMSR
jgi:hypothetical protein